MNYDGIRVRWNYANNENYASFDSEKYAKEHAENLCDIRDMRGLPISNVRIEYYLSQGIIKTVKY